MKRVRVSVTEGGVASTRDKVDQYNKGGVDQYCSCEQRGHPRTLLSTTFILLALRPKLRAGCWHTASLLLVRTPRPSILGQLAVAEG